MWELLRNAARHRYVLQNFVARDLRVKYRGSFLGYLWSLLEPLSLVGIYYFVFVLIARRGGPDYPLVVALGILPYTFFSSVITGGAGALTSNRSLIRRVFVPRELFVLGHVGSQLAVFAFSLLAVVPLLFVYGQVPGWRLILLPLSILLLTLLATGVALGLACANVLYRDVTYVLRVLLRVVFYASPVIYPLSLVPERLQVWYLLNPLATLLTMLRSACTNAPFEVPLHFAGLALAVSVGAFTAGAAV
ncbi:MAG: ABC transporter permease, partial [Myxococcota bacterium]